MQEGTEVNIHVSQEENSFQGLKSIIKIESNEIEKKEAETSSESDGTEVKIHVSQEENALQDLKSVIKFESNVIEKKETKPFSESDGTEVNIHASQEENSLLGLKSVIKLESNVINKKEAETSSESDSLEEFFKPKNRRTRRKKQLTKEQQEAKDQEDLRKRTCEICLMIFSIPKGLRNHMRVKHTFEKPYTCNICDEKFSIQSTYALHRRRHLGIKPHLCNICGKNFLRHTDLQLHMKTHNKTLDIKCNQCPNVYNSTMSLKKHILIKHTDPKHWKHFCQVCGKKCVSTTTLSLHLKQHNMDRSFKCHICGKGFYTNQNMKIHVRTHSADTKYNCEHCTNGYRSNEALQKHKLKMHGIGEVKSPSVPKFFCSICKDGFVQKARFERHLKLHETGQEEYPYKCEPCVRQYKDKNFFVMHMKNKHDVMVSDDYFKNDVGFSLELGNCYRTLVYKEESEPDELC